MDVTTMTIKFNITDSAVTEPDSSGVIANISATDIFIDLPFYLYQGFIKNVVKEDIRVELISDSTRQQTVKALKI